MQQATRPLFNFDPGWLFIAAGLVICVSGIILPAQEDLKSLRRQLDQLRAEEVHAYARLKAHSDFMDQVDRADPSLVRRLAAAQLNLVPAGDTPLLLASAGAAPVTDWIDNTVKTDIRPPKPAPLSALGQLANGRHRLWMFGGGIMAVFIGLLLGPSPVRTRRPAWRTSRYVPSPIGIIDAEHDDDQPVDALEPLAAPASDVIEIPTIDVEVKPPAVVDPTEHDPVAGPDRIEPHDQDAVSVCDFMNVSPAEPAPAENVDAEPLADLVVSDVLDDTLIETGEAPAEPDEPAR